MGNFFRKTSIDELPSFWNVIVGEMSIVGPRPLVSNQYDMIPEDSKEKIKLLKPGITGIGSVIFRDEEKYLQDDDKIAQEFYKTEIIPFKAILECWYHDNKSILIDILIIFFTVISVLIPKAKLYKYFLYNLPQHRLFNP